LAVLAKHQAEALEAARKRLATGKSIRLSDLEQLDRGEFHLLLELLGKALTEQKSPNAEVITTSSDGTLQVTFRPTDDSALAMIVTADGTFRGRDHYVKITDLMCVSEASSTGPGSSDERHLDNRTYETAGRNND
jgi:uncharacterized protein (TIGR02677 family)